MLRSTNATRDRFGIRDPGPYSWTCLRQGRNIVGAGKLGQYCSERLLPVTYDIVYTMFAELMPS